LRLLLIFENQNKKSRCKAKAIKEKLKYRITSINDVRVDANHIEVDLFSDDVGDAYKISADLNEKLIEIVDVNKEVNSDYRSYLIQGRFWEAHESLEERWKSEKNQKIKDSIRASIQFCAAMVHYQRCNDNTAKEILRRAAAIDSDIELVKSTIGVDLGNIDRLDPDLASIITQMINPNN